MAVRKLGLDGRDWQLHVAVARKLAVIMHLMWVSGSRVRDCGKEVGVGRRIVGAIQLHLAQPQPGRRDRPVRHAPCKRSPKWITRREIGRLNPRIPSWGSSDVRPRTEARSRNVVPLPSCEAFARSDWLWKRRWLAGTEGIAIMQAVALLLFALATIGQAFAQTYAPNPKQITTPERCSSTSVRCS